MTKELRMTRKSNITLLSSLHFVFFNLTGLNLHSKDCLFDRRGISLSPRSGNQTCNLTKFLPRKGSLDSNFNLEQNQMKLKIHIHKEAARNSGTLNASAGSAKNREADKRASAPVLATDSHNAKGEARFRTCHIGSTVTE